MMHRDTALLFCDQPMVITKYDDFVGDTKDSKVLSRFILSSMDDPDVGLATFKKDLVFRLILGMHPPNVRFWFSTYEFGRELLHKLKKMNVEYYIIRKLLYQRLCYRVESSHIIEVIGWPSIYGFAGTDLYVFMGIESAWENNMRTMKGSNAIVDMWEMKNLKVLGDFLDYGVSYIRSYGGEEDDLAIYTKKLLKSQVIDGLRKIGASIGIDILIVDGAEEVYWEKKRSGRLHTKPS